MRTPWASVVVVLAAAGCGTLLDVGDDPATPPPATDGGNAGDGGGQANGDALAPDGAAPLVDADAEAGASCTDTASDPNNCGACGRKCNVSGTCIGGKCDRFVVFVTSTTTTGTFSVAEADQKCAVLATTATLGGTFRAWMPGNGAASRFAVVVNAPHRGTKGDLVANSWPPGDTPLMFPIRYDEVGRDQPLARVWSELDVNGAVTNINNCLDWSTLNPVNQQGGYGVASATDSTWTQPTTSAVRPCNEQLHLYCVESP